MFGVNWRFHFEISLAGVFLIVDERFRLRDIEQYNSNRLNYDLVAGRAARRNVHFAIRIFVDRSGLADHFHYIRIRGGLVRFPVLFVQLAKNLVHDENVGA